MLKIVLFTIGAIILGWLIYRVIYLRRKKRQYEDAFSETFNGHFLNTPQLKTGYSYAHPNFEVIFDNEEHLKLAQKKGLTKDFEAKIQKIYKDIKDFEADRAVYFSWEGRTYSSYTTIIEN